MVFRKQHSKFFFGIWIDFSTRYRYTEQYGWGRSLTCSILVTLYGQRYVGFWYIRQKYPDMNGEQLFF